MTSVYVLMIVLLNISDPANVVIVQEAIPYAEQVKCMAEEKRLNKYYKGRYELVLIRCVNKSVEGLSTRKGNNN